MDNKISICIVEDDKAHCKLIKEYLSLIPDLQIVGAMHDGESAIDAIKLVEPDVIILDLALPTIDGFGVMKEIERSNLKNLPIIIVVTANSRATIAKMVFDYGAELIMIKPYKFEDLVARIRSLYNERNKLKTDTNQTSTSSNINHSITSILNKYGFPSNRVGYKFLTDSLKIILENPKNVEQITKIIYPKIAQKHRTTASNVERGIRHAIETVWNNQDPETLIKLYGNSVNPNKTRPTNSEFISNIAHRLIIESN